MIAAMAFTPRLLRRGDEVRLPGTIDEETELLFDGWVDGAVTTPVVNPNRHVTAAEVAALIPTAAQVASDPELREAFVLRPPGGSNGQMLGLVNGELGWITIGSGTDGGGIITPAPPTLRRLSHPFWTTPLSASAPLASTSADYVSRLAYQATMGQNSTPVSMPYGAPYNTGISTTDYSIAVYVMPEDAPRVPVWARDTGKTGLQSQLDQGVPMPDPTKLPDGTVAPKGTDGAIIIICGDELWELWQVNPAEAGTDPAGYGWRCQQGGYMENYHTHPGWWSGSPFYGGGSNGRVSGYDWGVSASGQSYLGGILTAEDFYADAIEHLLPLALPITGAGASTPGMVLPATRYDQNNLTYASNEVADAYRLPEGARFRLPTSFDIEGWVSAHAVASSGQTGSTATVLRKILVCLRDYGLMIAESAGIVGFSGEHEKVYGTQYHPYTAAQKPQWGNFGQQLPWSSLVQVTAPTVDISVPMGASAAPAAAGPTVRAVTPASFSYGGTMTPAWPAGTAAGDIVYATVFNPGGALTVPAGWTFISSDPGESEVYRYAYQAGATAPTWEQPDGSQWDIAYITVQGASLTTPQDAAPSVTDDYVGTTTVLPAATTATAGALVLYVLAGYGSAATVSGTGLTEIVNDSHLHVLATTYPSAGTHPGSPVTFSADQGSGHFTSVAISIKPA